MGGILGYIIVNEDYKMAKQLENLTKAPDFELKDVQGSLVRLSEVYSRHLVVLVVLRGFV